MWIRYFAAVMPKILQSGTIEKGSIMYYVNKSLHHSSFSVLLYNTSAGRNMKNKVQIKHL